MSSIISVTKRHISSKKIRLSPFQRRTDLFFCIFAISPDYSFSASLSNSHTSIPSALHIIISVLRLSVPFVSIRLTVHGPEKLQNSASCCWVQWYLLRSCRILFPVLIYTISPSCDRGSLPQRGEAVYAEICKFTTRINTDPDPSVLPLAPHSARY